MTTPTVYRSTHPSVLAAVAEHRVAAQAHLDRLRGFVAEHLPEGADAVVSRGWSRSTIVGFTHAPDAEPPAGWRVVDRGQPLLVPRKNTGLGRRAAAALEPLVDVPDLRAALPMPDLAMASSRVFTPAVAVRDDVVWVLWGCDLEALATAEDERQAAQAATGTPSGRNIERPDRALWELVPLSAYYALVEAGADPFGQSD